MRQDWFVAAVLLRVNTRDGAAAQGGQRANAQ